MSESGRSFPEGEYLSEHSELLLSSFSRLVGRELVDSNLIGAERYKALFEGPFAVVSHDTQTDPIFNYVNKAALELFEMSWGDFTQMPSRFSAEAQNREERERLLARVTEFGFIDDYRGVRISASGKRFQVEDAVVWNLIDEQGVYRGQAAVLYLWTYL